MRKREFNEGLVVDIDGRVEGEPPKGGTTNFPAMRHADGGILQVLISSGAKLLKRVS